jgi:hypothetical protein
MLASNKGSKTNPALVYCPMCKVSHHRDPEMENSNKISNKFGDSNKSSRRRVVMGSSDMHNLWKAKSFQPECHIDFDCIIGEGEKKFLERLPG